ncbi:MAG: sigma-70 family RNA polymerase sigma factor [Euzebya sp.]
MSTTPILANASTQDDEAALIRAYRNGDVDAFDSLYQQHFPALVRFLQGRLRDRATAEDVAQETMIRAMRNIDTFDVSRSLWPWLRRIAGNAAIDIIRANGRADALTTALSQMPGQAIHEIDLADDTVAEQDVIRRAMEEVPDRQRRALERCYLEGWRPTDVAGQFGVGSNAFEQLLHRARGNLRKAYRNQEGHERAAGLAWLIALVGPLQQSLIRLRRLGQITPRLGEAVAATMVAATMVVVATPPPAVEDAPTNRPPAVSSPIERDVPVPPATRFSTPAVPAERVAPAAQAPPVQAVPPSRPAPVAEDALPSTEPQSVPESIQVDTPAHADDPVQPAQELPESLPETVGGCGSAIRELVCAVDQQTSDQIDLSGS